jgi:hypothetical protein
MRAAAIMTTTEATTAAGHCIEVARNVRLSQRLTEPFAGNEGRARASKITYRPALPPPNGDPIRALRGS